MVNSNPCIKHQTVKRADNGRLVFIHYMKINHCRLNVRMAKKLLNPEYTHTLFQKMGGKAVTQGMHRGRFDNARLLFGIPENTAYRGCVKRLPWFPAGKQQVMRFI